MAVTSSTNIDAPADQVWSVLADLGSIYKWNPGVAKSHTTSELTQGEGATRHCDLDDKNYLEERAFDWREGESFKIDVFESSMPLESNIVTFQIAPDADRTNVTVTVDYKLKYGPIGVIMDMLFAKRMLQNGFDDMMAGLKYHVETGELVGDEVPEAVSA
jgi:uncharacterized membrane protein